jgi:hypothetical protein
MLEFTKLDPHRLQGLGIITDLGSDHINNPLAQIGAVPLEHYIKIIGCDSVDELPLLGRFIN